MAVKLFDHPLRLRRTSRPESTRLCRTHYTHTGAPARGVYSRRPPVLTTGPSPAPRGPFAKQQGETPLRSPAGSTPPPPPPGGRPGGTATCRGTASRRRCRLRAGRSGWQEGSGRLSPLTKPLLVPTPRRRDAGRGRRSPVAAGGKTPPLSAAGARAGRRPPSAAEGLST